MPRAFYFKLCIYLYQSFSKHMRQNGQYFNSKRILKTIGVSSFDSVERMRIHAVLHFIQICL